jgi:nitrate/nitrite transport system ATP-binding protein
VGEILEVELERPRDRLALAEDPAFNHYRAEVVKFLHERHAQPDVPVAKKDDEETEAKIRLVG